MRTQTIKAWLTGAAAAACATLAAAESGAQENTLKQFSLNRFEPAPAGDRFFGVQSPYAAGNPTELHAMLLLDYAHNPLVLRREGTDAKEGSIVENQMFGHLNLSLALFDRLNVNLGANAALFQSGDFDGTGFGGIQSPSGAEFGDLRFGLRLRLFGEYYDPFQIAVAGTVWFPTGNDDLFVGEGAFRGRPELVLGGRADAFVWSFNVGPELRQTKTLGNVETGNKLYFGAGVGLIFGDEDDVAVQVGPEATAAINLTDSERRNTNAEALLGGKLRFARDFELGAGVGTGLTTGIGTPDFRGVLSFAFTPSQKKATDRDNDGILDNDDACPDVPGEASADPQKNGCPPPPPPADKDQDGILDKDDACPEVAGVKSDDPTKHGCPPPEDKDGDGIPDEKDACADVAGEANEDPTKHGCPPDKDGDGIPDKEDACVDLKGIKDPDPQKNGCPGDTDGDTIRDDKDACPNEKGKPDPDPTKNGCPGSVRVTENEIIILQQVQFDTGRATIKKESNQLLDDVAGVIKEHPEILKLEVQGHTDSRGSKQLNTKLSDDRAKAVKTALVARGVEAGRLDSKGYGPDVPIGDNKTEEGRQQNRRVQFKIIEKKPKEAGAAPAPAPAAPAAPAPATPTPPKAPTPPKK